MDAHFAKLYGSLPPITIQPGPDGWGLYTSAPPASAATGCTFDFGAMRTACSLSGAPADLEGDVHFYKMLCVGLAAALFLVAVMFAASLCRYSQLKRSSPGRYSLMQ